MQDKRLITIVYEFQSRNYLVIHPVSFILYLKGVFDLLSKDASPSFILNPLSLIQTK